MLIIIITIVQANKSGVFKYIFAVYNFSPIELAGIPITSAAIPDFQHKPNEMLQAALKYGATSEIYIYLIFFILLILNTIAISFNVLGMLLIPSRIFLYTTGNTIKNEIKIDKFFDDIHIRHNIIKEATGTDCIVSINGSISILKLLLFDATIAIIIPIIKAKINPDVIFIKENKIDCQKSNCTDNSNNLFKVEIGVTKSTS